MGSINNRRGYIDLAHVRRWSTPLIPRKGSCTTIKGLKVPSIYKELVKEGIVTSREGIHKLLCRFSDTGCILRRPGSGRPSKMSEEIMVFVEEQMEKDDETTAHQLHELLKAKGFGISLRTVLRCRTKLGWTFRGSAYCQLIRDVNKEKRLEFVRRYNDDEFENVIYSDECTVQLESHRRFCCRKKGQPERLKPR